MRIVKRGNIWWAYFEYAGKRYRLSLRTPHEGAANVLKREIQTAITKGEFHGSWKVQSPLFENVLDEYLDHILPDQPRRKQEYFLYAAKHLRQFFSGLRIHQITPETIERFKTMRLEKAKPITVNRDLRALRVLLRQAVIWGFIEHNPMDHVDLVKVTPQTPRYLSPEEISKLLRTATRHVRVIIILALNTGMRRKEILSLRWSHIDFENKVMKLDSDVTPNPRVIPMNDPVVQVLREWKQGSRGNRVFTIKSFHSAWETTIRQAGIPHVRFKDLRQTFIHYMLSHGVDPQTLSRLLGYKNWRMATSHPEGLHDEQLRRVFTQLGQDLSGPFLQEPARSEDTLVQQILRRITSGGS